VLHWKLANLPAWESLPFDPPARNATVWLGISSFDSWDDFSGWFRRIAKGADELTPSVQAKADEIKRTYKTRCERMKATFEFVASLRYVAVECGIAGYRARTPEQVLTKRYGDCKDKANLLVALLRGMDIPAEFALVNRESSTDPDFPGWQFNHAVAFAPAAPDQGQPSEIWLDSTDTTTPFGSLPPGDIGRSALVFDKETTGFKTIQTAGTTLIRDEWDYTSWGRARSEGHFTGLRTGLADDGVRKQLRSASPLQRSFVMRSMLDGMCSGAEFENLKITDLSDLTEPVTIQADFTVKDRSGEPSPGSSFAFRSMGLMPERERDRPLWANDGQPFRYEQIARYPAAEARPGAAFPTPFEGETAGWHFSVQYARRDRCTIRTAVCEVRAPKVATSDYPALRKTLRLWLDALAQ
jgi:hypothetical protein